MRALARCCFALLLAGCRTPPWDEIVDGGGASPDDLAAPARSDLASRDLASADLRPADLARPPWCVPGSELIYTVEQDGALARFDPLARTFVDIGRLACPGVTAGPQSMAVQRNGTGWVMFDDGQLFRVDTRTAACVRSQLPTLPEVPGGGFGMGFTATTPGGMDETLYAVRNTDDEHTLVRIDLAAFRVFPVGAMANRAELSGGGDGRLWAFLPHEVNARVAELDRATAAERASLPVRFRIMGGGYAYAFARWGGEFWLFLRTENDPSTLVHRLLPDGTLTTVLGPTGRHVVGAGVSICAP